MELRRVLDLERPQIGHFDQTIVGTFRSATARWCATRLPRRLLDVLLVDDVHLHVDSGQLQKG